MKNIIVHGQELTREQAEKFLKRFKRKYEKNKDRNIFIFNDEFILTSYAKYLIEYLENCLNEK